MTRGDVSYGLNPSCINCVIANLSLNSSPEGIVYDNWNNEIYVAQGASVTVINGTSNLVVGSIPLQSGQAALGGMVFDSANGNLYDTSGDVGGSEVYVINGSSNKVAGNPITVVNSPQCAAYDSLNGDIYVAGLSQYISVINGSTNKVTATLQNTMGHGAMTPAAPDCASYNPINGDIYIADNNNTIWILNGTMNQFVGELVPCVGGEWSVTVNGANGDVFGTGGAWGYYVSFYNKSSGLNLSHGNWTACVPSTSYPFGIVYDGSDGDLYVANANTNNVSVINATTTKVVVRSIPVGGGPEGTAYDNMNQDVYVADTTSNSVTVISTKGSPSTLASVSVSPNSSILHTGKSATFVATSSCTGGPCPSGISYSWSINNTLGILNTTTGPSVKFTAGSTPGSVTLRVNATLNGITVTGTSHITMVSPVLTTHPVTFTASGLPAGTSWTVTLNGSTNSSTTSSIGFTEPNGTYGFTVTRVPGYSALPSSGTATVSGAPLAINITFTPIPRGSYTVAFGETGLPTGGTWSVTLAGNQSNSTGSIMTFVERNGTYNYSVGVPQGYLATPSTGSMTVNGRGVNVTIVITKAPLPTRYSVTFSETGLSTGTYWSVTFNGTPKTSTNSIVVFGNLLNNTTGYSFTVGAVSGYTPSPSSGTVVVNGVNVSRIIAFVRVVPTQQAYTVTFTESGLPPRHDLVGDFQRLRPVFNQFQHRVRRNAQQHDGLLLLCGEHLGVLDTPGLGDRSGEWSERVRAHHFHKSCPNHLHRYLHRIRAGLRSRLVCDRERNRKLVQHDNCHVQGAQRSPSLHRNGTLRVHGNPLKRGGEREREGSERPHHILKDPPRDQCHLHLPGPARNHGLCPTGDYRGRHCHGCGDCTDAAEENRKLPSSVSRTRVLTSHAVLSQNVRDCVGTPRSEFGPVFTPLTVAPTGEGTPTPGSGGPPARSCPRC